MDQFFDLSSTVISTAISSEIDSSYSNQESFEIFNGEIFTNLTQYESVTECSERTCMKSSSKSIDIHPIDNVLFDQEETLISFQNIPFLSEKDNLHDLLTDDLINDENINYPPNIADSIIYKIILKKINENVSNLRGQINYGLFTCITVLDNVLCIGTTRGYIFLLDMSNNMMLKILLLPDKYANLSSVTCISLSRNIKFLLASYSNGLVFNWVLDGNKPIPLLCEFPKADLFVQLKFSSDYKIAYGITLYSEGYLITFSKNGSEFKHKRFLTSNPKILSKIYPLILPKMWKGTVLARDYVLAALTSYNMIFIMAAKPERKIVHTIDVAGDSTNIHVSWGASSHVESVGIYLKIAFNCSGQISIYQAFCHDKMTLDKLIFEHFKSIKSVNPITFGWFTINSFFLISFDEVFMLIDSRTGETIEKYSLINENIVVTKNGCSNDSPSNVPNMYQNSIEYYKGRVYLLSSDSIQLLGIRDWKERIKHLQNNCEYLTLLKLLSDFSNGTADFVFDSIIDDLSFHQIVSSTIKAFIDHKFDLNIPVTSDHGFLFYYSKLVLFPMMKTLVDIKKHDYLFEECYPLIAGKEYIVTAFLDILVPLIITNKIKFLPYEILLKFKDRIAYFNMMPKSFEDCLLKLDVKGMDINPLFECCWNEKLYDGVFYLYSKGFNDCITPLKVLIPQLSVELGNSGQNHSSIAQDLGNSILRNIHTFLIDTSEGLINFSQVFKVFLTKFEPNDYEKLSWKYLRTILKFNLKDFVNILTIAFDFYSDRGMPEDAVNMIERKRRTIILVILQLLLSDKSISPSDISVFFVFMARQITLNPKKIALNKIVLEQILQYLTLPELSYSLEKQQALIELLQSGILEDISLDSIISMASNVNYHSVCEFAYEKQRKFDILLKYCCYNSDKKEDVFDTISRILISHAHDPGEYELIEKTVDILLEKLTEINSARTADLLYRCFPEILKNINARFIGKDQVKYSLYTHLFSYDATSSYSKKAYEGFIGDFSITEEYIRLLCLYDPSSVADFLLQNKTYRVSIVFGMLNHADLLYPKAILYEKMNHYKQAGTSYIEYIRYYIERYRGTRKHDTREVTSEPLHDHGNDLRSNFNIIFGFFERIFNKVDKNELEGMWFSLIDVLVKSLLVLQKDDQLELSDTLRDLGNLAFSNMSKQIPITSVINKIMNGEGMTSLPFGDVKHMIYTMSVNNEFDQICSKTLFKIISNECYFHLLQRERVVPRGVSSQHSSCSLCDTSYISQDSFNYKDDDIVLFWCKHSFHKRCISNYFRTTNPATVCPKCHGTQISSPRIIHDDVGKDVYKKHEDDRFRNFDKINQYFNDYQKNTKNLYNTIHELKNNRLEKEHRD